MNLGSSSSHHHQSVVDQQYHGVSSLLQSLDRLENTGDTFFDSLGKVGQGPPSLLAAQLVSMSQICQQMRDDAKSASLLNVPSVLADPVFAKSTSALPRSGTGEHAALSDSQALDAWVQKSSAQTSELFAERRRLTANTQAALSVPPPRRLDLR